MTAQPIASIGKGISVSTDGGQTYSFLDCDWVDGRADSILYQIWWDESGEYTLTVINESEGITTQFTGSLPSSAVTMLGVGVFGSSVGESVQFDSLSFQTSPGLAMQQVGHDLVLSWLAGFAGVTLQSTTNIGQPGGWVPVVETVQSANGISWVTIPMTAHKQFFRLSQ
jgi:hypothetical protein